MNAVRAACVLILATIALVVVFYCIHAFPHSSLGHKTVNKHSKVPRATVTDDPSKDIIIDD